MSKLNHTATTKPKNDIIVYPSSWYFNASYHGFLEVIAKGLGDNGINIVEESILQDDGRAIIPYDLARALFSTDTTLLPSGNEKSVPTDLKTIKKIAWWWVMAGYEAGHITKKDRERVLNNQEVDLNNIEKVETVCRSLFYHKGPYSNLAQPKWDKIEFLNYWFTLDEQIKRNEQKTKSVICSFCGQEYIPDTDASRIYDIFFTSLISTSLGTGPDAFPNRFWDSNPNLTLCKKCRSFFLFFHFTRNNRFFINSNSLKINWHLNRLLSDKLKHKQFAYQTALLDSLRLDPQLRKGISGWGLQNIEVLIFKDNDIVYYPLSQKVARMFLMPEISSALGKLSSTKLPVVQTVVQNLWDIILTERFEYLPGMVYKSLRAFLIKNKQTKDPRVVFDDIQPLVNLIILSGEIVNFLQTERGEKNMNYINTRQLRSTGAAAPFTQENSLVFRLLELTRLNKRSDVYHLLLQMYVARKVQFPNALAQVFSEKNSEIFKTGIYAFISGLKLKESEEAETRS